MFEGVQASSRNGTLLGGSVNGLVVLHSAIFFCIYVDIKLCMIGVCVSVL